MNQSNMHATLSCYSMPSLPVNYISERFHTFKVFIHCQDHIFLSSPQKAMDEKHKFG